MRDDERGVSEVVGYVLLVGMVLGGMSLVLLTGATAIEDLRTQADEESATLGMGELDARLGSLTSQGVNRTTLGFDPNQVDDLEVVPGSRGGEVNVSINGGECHATVPLSSVRYTDDGDVLAYEGGGVWRSPVDADASALVAPPDFTFQDGTIDLTVVNLTGGIASERVVVRKLDANSTNRSDRIESRLFNGSVGCRRPDNVTVRVDSDYRQAWAEHLRSQTGIGASYAANGTARSFVPQSKLPESTDDSRNDVVVLSRSGSTYGRVYSSNETIRVNKSAGNDYTVYSRPLDGGLQVSYGDTFENDVAYRPPLDVVFVFDESGSMGWDANADNPGCSPGSGSPGCQSKRDAAQDAARNFVGRLNESYDRVGVTGFTSSGGYPTTGDAGRVVKIDGQYFSDSFRTNGDEVNDTVGTTRALSGTYGNRGLAKANSVFGFAGEPSRDKVMIFLSDGRNDDPDTTNPLMIQRARNASNDLGVTVYTVGFGTKSYLNETVLNYTANVTGGSYYFADNASELNDVFQDIFATITETKAVVNEPVALNATVGSRTYQPTVGDDVDETAPIDSDGDGAPENVNLNDPTAPPFSLSMQASDGDLTNLTAYSYDCREYATTSIVRRNATTGAERVELRCVDVNESSRSRLPTSSKRIYLDDDSAWPLLKNATAWWEKDFENETLREGGFVNNMSTADRTDDEFSLKSNQAIVVFEFGNNRYAPKRLVMLYEIGVSNRVRATEIVDVRVVETRIEDDD